FVLGAVVAHGVGGSPGPGAAQDLQRARDIGGPGGDVVPRDQLVRAVLAAVFVGHGVAQHVSTADRPARVRDVFDDVGRFDVRRIEFGGEGDDARVVGVTRGGQADRRARGFVAEDAIRADQVCVEAELVCVVRFTFTAIGAAFGDRAVEEI